MLGMINLALLDHRPFVLHIEEDGEADVDEDDEIEEDPKESECTENVLKHILLENTLPKNNHYKKRKIGLCCKCCAR
jgi:hypothetical protein